MSSKARWLTALPFMAAALALLAWLIRAYWPFTIDDSFITFRYAAHLAAGLGPVYNPGLPRAEGYTTFLWMLIMAIPHAAGLDAVAFAKWAGAVMTAGTLAVVFFFTLHLTRFMEGTLRGAAAGMAALLLAAFGPTSLHAVAGMETPLFTLLLTIFLWLVTVYTGRPDDKLAAGLSVTALLLGLTRPEGNLAALAGLGVALALIPPRQRLSLLKTAGLLYGLPGAAYFIWRAVYYGTLLPLPFYIKVASQALLAGWPDVASYGRHMLVRLGVPIALALPRVRRDLVPALTAAGVIVVFFLFPAHIMGYSWRYLYPLTPFLYALAVSGLGSVIAWGRSQAKVSAAAAPAAALTACLLIGGSTLADTRQEIENARWYGYSLEHAHAALGRRLAAFPADGQTMVLAIGDAGAAPYYAGWRTIDTFGLNDRTIALSGHDPGYVFSHNPDVVVLISQGADEFTPRLEWEQALYEACRQHGLAKIAVVPFNYYDLWVMAAPDSPIAAYLQGEW